ncbi:MAG: Do family serine endopeptidase [Pseudomonadota bacterium]
MKRSVFWAAFLLLTSLPVFAQDGFWVDGKDRPAERVNLGLKSLTPDVFTKISEKVDDAVVNISTTKFVRQPRGLRGRPPVSPGPYNDQDQNPLPPFFGDPFGNDFFDWFFNSPRQEMRQQSLGSGFILNPDGYIVTNNHMVERADEIKVVLKDETQLNAKIVGRDPKTDIALLKVDSKKPLVHVILGDSSQLKVGDIIVAIGNPFGLSHTLTQGIVSAKERSIGFGSYDAFIQTDASINPGNSGGPLLNLQGEVVGIATAIVASGQGIGFAIPINLAKGILLKLHSEGKVVRGWLGVMIQKLTDETTAALKLPSRSGALVSNVQKNSPAAKAGIQAGDVIVKFNGKAISEYNDLPMEVANTQVGAKVAVEVIRDGRAKIVEAQIQELQGEDGGPEGTAETAKSDVLGLSVRNLAEADSRTLGIKREDLKGVVVTGRDEASAAAEHGIRSGDVIVEVDRTPTPDVKSYRNAIAGKKKGDSVLLLVKRHPDATLFVAFTI